MSSKMYQHNIFSDDDDEIVKHSPGSTPRSSRKSNRPGRKSNPNPLMPDVSNRYCPPNDIAEKMRVASKYDHKPRNIVFDGQSFRPRKSHRGTSHRSRADSHELLSGDAHGGGGTVSIAEFERNEGYKGEVKGYAEMLAGGGASTNGGLYLWFWEAHWQKRLAIACVMGVVFGVLFRGYDDGFFLGLTPRDDLLECPAKMNKPCLTSSQLKPALPFVQSLCDLLHTRAGQAECGDEGISKGISILELQAMFPKSADILYLIHHNPHWNILWLDSNGTRVPDWSRYPLDTDLLQSTTPSISVMCTVSRFFSYVWMKIRFIILVTIVILVLLGVVRWYIQKKRIFEKSKFVKINEILGILRKHNETILRKNGLLPYLAIIHVRDMLITPSERDSKLKIWDSACLWISKYESRVRTETHRIAGEDFACWRWIQAESPKIEELLIEEGKKGRGSPSATPQSLVNKKSSLISSSRKKNWYSGTTFEDESGRNVGRNNQMNSPYGSPSPCIRLKNMFEAKRHLIDEQSKEIEDSVLDRCIAHGGVVHIYVDRRSNFGCVFLKMDCIESAVGAYNGMHGGWYKGKLVTAKYIPIEKYYKWFPLAATAQKHITPST